MKEVENQTKEKLLKADRKSTTFNQTLPSLLINLHLQDI